MSSARHEKQKTEPKLNHAKNAKNNKRTHKKREREGEGETTKTATGSKKLMGKANSGQGQRGKARAGRGDCRDKSKLMERVATIIETMFN